MKRTILSWIWLVVGYASASAQPNDLMIIYDANQGVSGLAGANKVYMYSGAVTSGPSGQWEWITGSINLDDGVGLMTPIGNNVWTICIDPPVYYGTPQPILAIDIIFRNENGTAFGYDFNGTYIILDMSTPQPTSSFAGVTTTNCGVGINELTGESAHVFSFPNPFSSTTTIAYNLPANATDAKIHVYETTGKKVISFNIPESSPGRQFTTWDGKNNHGDLLKNGVYYYVLEVNGANSEWNKLVIAR